MVTILIGLAIQIIQRGGDKLQSLVKQLLGSKSKALPFVELIITIVQEGGDDLQAFVIEWLNSLKNRPVNHSQQLQANQTKRSNQKV